MKIKQLSPTFYMEISNIEQYLSKETLEKIELVVNRARFEVVKVEKLRAVTGSTNYTVKELNTSYIFTRTVSNENMFTKEEMRRYFQEKMYYIMLKERFEKEKNGMLREGDVF